MALSYETQFNDLLQKAWELGINITEVEVPPSIYKEFMMTNVATTRYSQPAGFTANIYESGFGTTRILLGNGSSKLEAPTPEPSKLKEWFDNHK